MPYLQCFPISGLGFRRGSYKCICRDGYYFPNTELDADQRYFKGSHIEEQYELMANVSNNELYNDAIIA